MRSQQRHFHRLDGDHLHEWASQNSPNASLRVCAMLSLAVLLSGLASAAALFVLFSLKPRLLQEVSIVIPVSSHLLSVTRRPGA